ncbi:DUF418 domain-containing protein [Micromonospora sp. RTGN7]|uniref:DUF418 domain-containing protein n=1 Tax=Micromonospora sp. RTGN7 TaxID=3016526 RepID=UPI0029FF2A75|nr:DUF418 domain-containing protein [Micromonospora sp. RTGN7]
MATAVTTAAGPTGTRIALLDVLRGVAILGTLATNVWIFATPGSEARLLVDAAAVSATANLTGGPVAAVAEGVFRFLANGKFLALLTILFGVGLAIQHGSAVSRGRAWPGRYGWRALLLFVEGTLHFVLVFAFDVLMGYAVTALLVAWLLARSARVQKVAMSLAAGVHLTLMGLLTLALALAPPDERAVPDAPGRFFTEGGYLAQVTFRLANWLPLRAEPIISFGLLVFLFLLGVRLLRAGAFGTDDRGRALRRRLLRLGLGVGLPLNAATTLAGPELFLVDRYVCAPLLAVGYLGLVGVLLDRRSTPGAVTSGLTAVGRTALSCYVLQNVLCVVVCYGWGLGLARSWQGAAPWWVLGLWAGVSGTLVLVASWWTGRFGAGPLEAAQRAVLRRLDRPS